jgi:hypothetical protein
MLFILGHGLVVGNDIFLFDEHVDSDQHSLSLTDLGIVLNDFSQYVRYQNAEFELVSFHSCSVSSLEVAYQLQYEAWDQLKGVANYMLASQGPAFVGSWPYREIVIRVLNDVARLKKNRTPINVSEMLGKIFDYVFHNCSDFLLAGYSFQLTLCDLNKVSGVTASLKKLSDDLVKGLGDPAVRNLILLAHWKSISYWGENYTDLYDFCFCLSDLCKKSGMGGTVGAIQADCGQVMDQLSEGDNRLVNRVNFAGPTYQYSHGLSVFYPWVTPQDDFMKVYEDYRFGVTSWKSFLKTYFDETERATLREELGQNAPVLSAEDELEEDIASICFNNEGPLNIYGALGDGPKPVKTDVRDPTGDDCACGTIKNYPHDTRPRRERNKQPLDVPLPLGTDAINLF